MNSRNSITLGAAALLVSAAACGSGGNGTTGTMNVHLVDAPGAYQTIELDVQSVEIWSQETGWTVLGSPRRTIDVLKLQNGADEVLASAALIPAGTYGQMRLILGDGSTVTLLDGTEHALKVPSGMQSGVKLPVHFVVEPGTTKEVFIDVAAERSVFFHQAGHSGQYILRPVMRALDRVATGSVSGKITDGAGIGLAGVTVMAEVVDAAGNPTVVNSAVTGADGTYSIGLLPVDATYYLVAQPVVGATVYAPKASHAITLTAASPLATFGDGFSPVPLSGSILATVTPVADADDTVSALQPLDVGELLPRLLVVRMENAVVTDATETATLANLPVGSYALVATRATSDAEGTVSMMASSSSTAAAVVTVTPGGTASALLTFH